MKIDQVAVLKIYSCCTYKGSSLGSYLPHMFQPVVAAGKIQFVDSEIVFVPGRQGGAARSGQ